MIFNMADLLTLCILKDEERTGRRCIMIVLVRMRFLVVKVLLNLISVNWGSCPSFRFIVQHWIQLYKPISSFMLISVQLNTRHLYPHTYFLFLNTSYFTLNIPVHMILNPESTSSGLYSFLIDGTQSQIFFFFFVICPIYNRFFKIKLIGYNKLITCALQYWHVISRGRFGG